jgi:predicted nucleotidyltransferase
VQLDQPLAVVTPTVDGDVLTALARVDAQLTVRQVASVLGRFSDEGIRKVLVRLVAQGIVLVEVTGRTSSYRLNREHLAADAVIAVSNSRERLLERLTAALREWPVGVRYAAVFGSASRGGMRPGSDIDLLLVHDDDASQFRLDEGTVDLLLRVRRWTGNPLSVQAMPVRELQERVDDRLLRDVRRDALTVAGSRSWFEAQFRGQTGRNAHA